MTATAQRPLLMPEAAGSNFFLADPNLAFALQRLLPPEQYQRALPILSELGSVAGGELDALAREAERHPPALHQFDQRGERVDEIDYHPSYQAMERIAFGRFGFAAMSHRPGVLGWPDRVPHLLKYALSYVFVQAEFGLFCPVSMTDSTARMLRLFASEQLQASYLPGLTVTEMPRLLQGAMFMTEKQAGSDVGQTQTHAQRDHREWRLFGDKWFCSNVSADVILTLARPAGAADGTRGLGLFLLPKRLPDGSRNRYRINRLKDKLGTRDMATGEVTLDGAVAYPVGDLERGFRQMAEMINVSRLSNAMRAAALMRRGLLESLVHAGGREAFGRRLIDLPLMRVTLFDMLLETEAALTFVLDTAATLDAADAGADDARRLVRILTPLAKAVLTRRARGVTGEALETRGGNGYIEEWVEPRLLRDSHLGSVWEGATNVVALDVLRAAGREGAGDVCFEDCERRLRALRQPAVRAVVPAVLRLLDRLRARLLAAAADGEAAEASARRLVERLADLRASTLLLEEAESRLAHDDARKLLVAAAFLARRFGGDEQQDAADAAAVRWLPAVVAWEPLPVRAVAALIAAISAE